MAEAPLLCVCLKPAWRTDVRLRLDAAGTGLRAEEALQQADAAGLAALGLALELRARLPGGAGRVLALTVGPPAADDVLREALAAGAGGVLRVWGRDWPPQPLPLDGGADGTRAAAALAAEALRPHAPLLVLAGERSADTGHECFGGFLAAALGAAFAHRVTAVEPDGADWRVTVRLERGYGQALRLSAPAVLTVSAQLPRPGEAPLPAWLASRAASIPLAAPEAPPPAPAPAALRIPVPRVKHYAVPGRGLPAEARIAALVTLPAQGGGTVLVDTPPEAQADAVLALLRERGYLASHAARD